ncbi:hypothetical protein ACET3Z_027652 [Daucus carota]
MEIKRRKEYRKKCGMWRHYLSNSRIGVSGKLHRESGCEMRARDKEMEMEKKTKKEMKRRMMMEAGGRQHRVWGIVGASSSVFSDMREKRQQSDKDGQTSE